MAVANGSGRGYKTKGSGATHLGRCFRSVFDVDLDVNFATEWQGFL
uniref:Uncharacterized protein n=2 Tax=Oryza sativa subsp. japonica TaxID=39947 RepID=Q2R7Q3_ORYSJ|nr:hypothetical protein LOC_Os11g15330 [Oryza sativa Japonica Group]AAX96774.1 hypothetical protein [Oryza sativa Japonica Group]ABA92536.1 hypothetical protein LOC_Os11g15329 [Oryza sativa Japonica Group]